MDNYNKIYKYFPYQQPRPEQKIITPNIYNFIRDDDKDGMILSAGPGTGKEACFTSQGLLALEDNLFNRVLFTIPTDIGKDIILKELGKVNHNKNVLKILSKEILCNWLKEKKDERISALEKDASAYDLCKLQGHKCKYKGVDCNYEAQKKFINNANILICDYNYFLSPFIRRASGFDEIFKEKILLLIDECHMLEKRAEMIFSSSISSTTIEHAIKELEYYGYNEEKRFIEKILKAVILEETRHDKKLKLQIKEAVMIGEIVIQSYVVKKFFGSGTIDDIGMVGERLIYIGEEISNLKFEQKKGIISHAERIGNFILRFYKILLRNKENSNIFFLKLKSDGTMYLGWDPIDVRGFIRNGIKKAVKYALYSGTIKNASRLRDDVGLTLEKIYIPNHIESPYVINRKDIILTKERFCFQNINDKAFSKRIIEDLDRLLPNMKKPIGIICTDPWYDSLKLSSIYKLLNEPEKQEDVEYWLKNLVPDAQLIRYTPFGRIALSIDLSYLKSILFLGFPYEKYGPIMEEKINKTSRSIKNKTGNPRAMAIYLKFIEPALERIVQSVMRGLRNEKDRLNVIYYDINFKLNKPSLGSKNIVVCKTIDEAISYLII